ncbi:MAG: hypothetical protein AB7O21_19420 [Gammaproteobacteria bacterium]
MTSDLTKLGVAAAFTLLSLAASAATVQVEAFLVTQHGVEPGADVVLNAPGCTIGSTASSECTRLTQTHVPGMPFLDTGTVTTLRSAFDPGNVSAVPNYVMNGTARAFGSTGALHASTFVQIQGAGGSNVTAGGRAHAQVTDRVTVRSSTLPDGSTVVIKVRIDVSGSGGGRLWFGAAGGLSQVGIARDLGLPIDSLEDYETTFSAKVGSTLTVSFGLTAYTRMLSNGWGAGDVLNGRNNSADYGNSAFLYMEGVDPALGVSLDNGTGYSYAFPTAVPLPGAAVLLLSALPLASGKRRRMIPLRQSTEILRDVL